MWLKVSVKPLCDSFFVFKIRMVISANRFCHCFKCETRIDSALGAEFNES